MSWKENKKIKKVSITSKKFWFYILVLELDYKRNEQIFNIFILQWL